jgi:hypothetical protein
MDQHDPSAGVPSAECSLCEQFATAISSLLSRQPKQFDLVSLELFSDQMLYERVDEVDGYDLFSGLYLAETSKCSTCTALADSIVHRALRKVSEPVSTLKSSKLSLSGPMCATGCFILDVSHDTLPIKTCSHHGIDRDHKQNARAAYCSLVFRQLIET